MSDTQAKAMPSKAALDLVRVLLYPFHVLVTEQQYQDAAAVVDESISDLLEKATRREWLLSRIIDDLPSNKDWLDPALELEARSDTSLKSALEPWKPGE